jgi:hypothetical protein
MSQRKCHMCGRRTAAGEECTIVNQRKSRCRPELAAPMEREVWLCDDCLWAAQVVGEVGEKYQREHEPDDE